MTGWLRLAPYAIGAVLAAGSWGHGNYTGRQSERARSDAAIAAIKAEQAAEIEALETRLADVSSANRAAAAIIEANRIAQQTLAQEIEDEARQDPDAVRRVPAADSLRRLERRWGGPG